MREKDAWRESEVRKEKDMGKGKISLTPQNRHLAGFMELEDEYLVIPPEIVVDGEKMLARSCCVEVFVLSCYIAETNAKAEKNAWLDRYLPEVDTEHRIFVPCGEGKDEYVPGCVLPTDTLLDDYSVNLHSWKAAGGNAVKLRNGINGNHGTWKGPSVDMKYQPGMLSCCVLAHAIHGADRHDRTAKEAR